MTIQTALGFYLSQYSALTAKIADRLYPVRAPQDALYPHVIYRVTVRPLNPVDGPSPAAEATLCTYAMSNDYDEATEVADAMRQALHYFKGTMAQVDVTGSLWVETTDEDIPTVGQFEVSSEFQLIFSLT
jgi:hypothetical protein